MGEEKLRGYVNVFYDGEISYLSPPIIGRNFEDAGNHWEDIIQDRVAFPGIDSILGAGIELLDEKTNPKDAL